MQLLLIVILVHFLGLEVQVNNIYLHFDLISYDYYLGSNWGFSIINDSNVKYGSRVCTRNSYNGFSSKWEESNADWLTTEIEVYQIKLE